MKRKVSHLLVAVLTAGALLGSTAANAAPAKVAAKAAKHASHAKKNIFYSAGIECDGSGGAAYVVRICGFRVSSGGSVPNSALCD